MLFGRNGEFGVEDICDLRFCGRSIGLFVMGSLKRGPLAAFSGNSERFLCREAPLWHFLPVLVSLLGVSSVLFSAGWRRCGSGLHVPSGEGRSFDSQNIPLICAFSKGF